MREPHIYPVQPLQDRTGLNVHELARYADVAIPTVEKWKRRDMTLTQADRLACAVHTHPGLVWPDLYWSDNYHSEDDVTTLEHDGYLLMEQAVDPEAVDRAKRELLIAIRENGLSTTVIREWQSSTFFPWLRDEPWVWNLLPEDAGEVLGQEPGDQWCEPQLLIRLPDSVQEYPITYHTDEEPPWAGGRTYKGIVGVSLTDTGPEDGGTQVLPGSHLGNSDAEPVQVEAKAGDALVFDPNLLHAGTLNRGSSIRMAVFFRLLGKEVQSRAA